MAAALLRLGAARRLGGSMLQRAHAAVAEQPRRQLLGPRLKHTMRAPEEITRDIKQKHKELSAVMSEARRSLWAAGTNWRTQEGLFDAVSNVRTDLIEDTLWTDEGLFDQAQRIKWPRMAWELLKFCADALYKITLLVLVTSFLWVVVSASIELRREEKKRKQEE